MLINKKILVAGALLGLAACTTPLPRPAGPANWPAWDARQQKLGELDHWQLDGRVAIIAGEEGGSGSLDWSQQADSVDFRVSGPFGAGAFSITGTGDLLTLRTADGGELTTRNLEYELAWRLGYVIPVRSMRWWVRGLPAPAIPAVTEVDGAGRLQVLEQRGWRVEYREYVAVGDYALPSRLTIEGEGVRLKFAIQDWTLGAARE